MQKTYFKGIKNIVFDLGGVIITLDQTEAVQKNQISIDKRVLSYTSLCNIRSL
jgi:hypothetical protein